MIRKIKDLIELLVYRYKKWKIARKRKKEEQYHHIYPMW